MFPARRRPAAGSTAESGPGETSRARHSTHKQPPPLASQCRDPRSPQVRRLSGGHRRRAPALQEMRPRPPAARLAAEAGSARPHWPGGGACAGRGAGYITGGEWAGRRSRSTLRNAGCRAEGALGQSRQAGAKTGGGGARRGPEVRPASRVLRPLQGTGVGVEGWEGPRPTRASAAGIGRSSRQSLGGGTRAGLTGPHVRGGQPGGWARRWQGQSGQGPWGRGWGAALERGSGQSRAGGRSTAHPSAPSAPSRVPFYVLHNFPALAPASS